MQYLNTMLWETFDETVPARIPDAYPEDPMIIKFESACKQPSHIVGRSLRDYEPLKTEVILGDGSCLLRCLSKITTGSENSHLQLRCTISQFISSERTTKLGWYQGRASLSFPSQVKPTLLPMSYIFSQVIIYFEKTLVKKFHY